MINIKSNKVLVIFIIIFTMVSLIFSMTYELPEFSLDKETVDSLKEKKDKKEKKDDISFDENELYIAKGYVDKISLYIDILIFFLFSQKLPRQPPSIILFRFGIITI